MKTAMQEFFSVIKEFNKELYNTMYNEGILETALEKEKEDLMKAFSDGQETPINHPTLPHYSREEYYNDNYNQN